MYTIAVDAMGGDHAPEVPVKGSLEALRAFDAACGNRPAAETKGHEKKKKSFMDKLKETFEE